ncbi:Uncharacterized protein GNX_2730 [Leptospira interrogans serovar Canicola]|nr:Uncharacterized protein GNX_2730 [Leptospira interrogans serovar Canicola]
MKVKVAHLFRKIEEVDRDILELGKIQEKISSDRDYSEILKDSIRKEMKSLESGKAEILSLKIKEESGKIGLLKNSVKSSPTEMKNLYSSREKKFNSGNFRRDPRSKTSDNSKDNSQILRLKTQFHETKNFISNHFLSVVCDQL